MPMRERERERERERGNELNEEHFHRFLNY